MAAVDDELALLVAQYTQLPLLPGRRAEHEARLAEIRAKQDALLDQRNERQPA